MPPIFISQAGDKAGHAVSFNGLYSFPALDERLTYLENLDIETAAIGVSSGIEQKAVGHGGSHDRLFFGQGVSDHDMAAPLVFLSQAELINGFRRDETVVDHLV